MNITLKTFLICTLCYIKVMRDEVKKVLICLRFCSHSARPWACGTLKRWRWRRKDRSRLTGGVGEEDRAGQRQEEERRQLHDPCGRAEHLFLLFWPGEPRRSREEGSHCCGKPTGKRCNTRQGPRPRMLVAVAERWGSGGGSWAAISGGGGGRGGGMGRVARGRIGEILR